MSHARFRISDSTVFQLHGAQLHGNYLDEIYWFFYDPHERNTVDASEIPNSQPATVGYGNKNRRK